MKRHGFESHWRDDLFASKYHPAILLEFTTLVLENVEISNWLGQVIRESLAVQFNHITVLQKKSSCARNAKYIL